MDYLKELAALVGGRFDDNYKKNWNWCVKRRGQYIVIDEYLPVQDEWRTLIGKTITRIQEVENARA